MIIRSAIAWLSSFACSALLAQPPAAGAEAEHCDFLISGGTVYDGSGDAPFIGDVAIRGDRLAYVGPHAPGAARERIDAHGKAVAPGFINMLAHPEESLLADGRALSDLRQGVTLEVLGEDSMGPLTAPMKRLATRRQADIRYTIDRIQDHSTYERPQQLATGVDDVWVNGVRALRHGEATGAASGRAVRGRAWTGAVGGGCRAGAREWTWSR